MGMMKEFKEFALKGNMLDLAVAVIIGGAFGGIVKSLIDDIIMPPVGLLLGKVDFRNLYYPLSDKVATGLSLDEARKAGPVLAYGNFITILINFIILAFIIFLVVKAFNTAKKKFEKQQPAAAPAGPTPDQKLLTEIRDLLARK
ncbi:MAG TPA: large conductance mechanosensitive channel protein MscL [Phycisphaerales bacterium]|jgi:large conductance mechanosensitive channel|nr:large conductance mechanosensitive channel protein MscL [Phycisphaerales bacterium]